MKHFILTLFLAYGVAICQDKLDTIKVYNVNCCSETVYKGITQNTECWFGSYSFKYPPENCISPEKRCTDSHQAHSDAMNSEQYFWIQVYDSSENLILEALRFSDVFVGKYIVYHPNGKLMTIGEFTPCILKKNGKLKYKKNKTGIPTGTWKNYDKNGRLIQSEEYP